MISLLFATPPRGKRSLAMLLIILYFQSSLLECLELSAQIAPGEGSNSTNADDSPYGNYDLLLCTDKDPGCKEWALIGECRKKSAIRYMKANCPESCNLCNPNFEKWTPTPKHKYDGREFHDKDKYVLTQRFHSEKMPVYHGVPQTTNFSTSLLTEKKRLEMQGGQSITGVKYYRLRTTDVIESMRRYLDVIYEEHECLVDNKGYLVDKNTPNANFLRYSPVDIEAAPYNSRVFSTETCVNRHPYCALWAVLGYCASKSDLMADMCSPMCQSCDTNWKTIDGTFYEKAIMRSTPFQRDDLHGIFESIYNNNVIVNPNFPVINYYKLPSNMKIESRKDKQKKILYLNFDSMKVKPIIRERSTHDQRLYRKELNSNGTGPLFSTMVSIEKFLSPEECRELLDVVMFGVGVDSSVHGETEQDGFPVRTMDAFLDQNGDEFRARYNSRVSLFPSIKDTSGVMRYSNAIERLLQKISALTGMDAVAKIESPIIYERYKENEYMIPESHFKGAVLNSDKTHFSHQDMLVEFGDQYKFNDYPDKMENPRVLGMVIFLNGSGKEQDGGSIYFPNMKGEEIFPLAGAAVLFPTVASLIAQDKINGVGDNTLDMLYNLHDQKTYLVEDLQTIFGHNPVTKGSKYCMKLYFRRNIESNRQSN